MIVEQSDQRAAWEGLSLFESHDYLRRWFRGKHDRDLNSAKATEITSSFVQGREYFVSAHEAGSAVKPLLLYYGCLALTRGAVLANSPTTRADELSANHGLTTSKWRSVLDSGPSKVLDISISSSTGIFRDFVRVLGNKQTTVLSVVGDRPAKLFALDLGLPAMANDANIRVSLDDLLSRDHRMGAMYTKVSGRPSLARKAGVIIDGQVRQSESTSLFSRSAWVPTKANITLSNKYASTDEVRSAFHLPIETRINENRRRRLGDPPSVIHSFSVDRDEEVFSRLPMVEREGEQTFLSENFQNGDRFSLLHRTYLTGFIFGMLVRYYPATWTALLGNGKGAGVQPLLRAAIDCTEAEFPWLLWEQLQ